MGLLRDVVSKAVKGSDETRTIDRLQGELSRLHRRVDGLEARVRELEGLTGRLDRIEDHVGPLPPPPAAAFSAEMTLAEVRAAHPRADEVLARHHLGGCAACAVADVETLREGAAVHQLDLEALLGDLQALPPA